MQSTQANPNSRATDPEWCFLGKYPLNELMTEMDDRDGTHASKLFQTIREMGIHPELLNSFESMLMGFVKEGVAQLSKGSYQASAFIRLFCQKTTMEDISSTKSSGQFAPQQTSEPSHIIHHSGAGMHGGWGCFLIIRGDNESEAASPRAQVFVDLYLYREG